MAKIFQSKYAGQEIEQLLDKTLEKRNLLDNLSETEEELCYKNQTLKDAIGLGNVTNTSDADKPISKAQQEALDKKVPDTRTVNGKPLSEDVMLSSSDVGADEKGTASTAVSTHNTATDSHNDIRLLITELTNRLNALANSDDITLDQMNELVAYIKANRGLIEGVTTSKVNVTDIINNLTTNSSDKVLSAAQGVAIKSLIDALQESLDGHVDNASIHVTPTDKTNWNNAKTHAESSHAPTDAEKNTIIGIQKNGTDLTPNSSTRKVNITVPTKVSELLNDVGYKTTEYTHPTSGVNTGTYRSVTVDKNGHVTGGSNPTTLSGYGITDAEEKGTTSTHNTSTTSHSDIRDLITGLTTRLNALANSDDTTLDQMSEIVAYIKNNKSLIESVTTSKVNVSDIINNLTTNVSNKPLSASQGVALKSLIDTLQSSVNALITAKHTHSNSNVLNNTTASYTTEEQEQVKAIPDVYQKKTIKVIKGLGEWTAGSGVSGFLTGVCYGNGKFVAVAGMRGGAYYSEDGITWTAGSGASGDLKGVCYGNDKFVAVDNRGGAYYSKDGITWTAGSGASGYFNSVCYGNGKFVAVGNATYYSKDGITWTAGGSGRFNSVCYGNDKFVAVGASGATYYSEDGITWTAGSGASGSSSFSSVCYGNGKFVAVNSSSAIYYSEDGITWTAGSNGGSGYLMGVCYGNGRFVAVGTATYYSKDGITWTAGSSGRFSSVCYGNGKFVAVNDMDGAYYSEFIKEQRNLEDVINELYELLT